MCAFTFATRCHFFLYSSWLDSSAGITSARPGSARARGNEVTWGPRLLRRVQQPCIEPQPTSRDGGQIPISVSNM